MSDKTSNELVAWTSASFYAKFIYSHHKSTPFYLKTFLSTKRMFLLTQSFGNGEFADRRDRVEC